MERWKDIDGFDCYKVSSFGRVKSKKRETVMSTGVVLPIAEKILKPWLNDSGYPCVTLRKNKVSFSRRVHRLVAIAFIPNPDNKPEVNHIDWNTKNSHVSNLEWATSKENSIHASKNGLLHRDIDHGSCKISRTDVMDIRNTYRLGCFSQTEIADAYGMNQGNVSRIINRDTWDSV